MNVLDPVELLAEMITVDSQNPEPGEARIAGFVAELLEPFGFSIQRLEYEPGRTNLIAVADAGPGRSIGLCGHLDTKPVGQALAQWRTPPLELTVDGDMGYGLGTSDMKGAIAAMIVAARTWAATAERGRLSLVLTADEEAGSTFGAWPLARAKAVDVDALLIGEPSGVTDPWESMFLVSRGISTFDVVIEGRQGHSGFSDRLTTSATVAAARALLAIDGVELTYPTNDRYDCHPTVNAGVVIEGGVAYGVHPGAASVSCDVRLIPGMTREQLEQDVTAVLESAMPADITWSIRFQPGDFGFMPAVQIDPEHPLVQAAQDACASVLGRSLPFAAYPGGTDATAFSTVAGIPCVASLGPGWLTVAHGPNECVGISQVRQAVDLYHHLVVEYLNGSDR